MKVIKNLLALIGAVTVGVFAYAAYQVATGEATVETEDEDDYDDITLTLQHKKTEVPAKETESKPAEENIPEISLTDMVREAAPETDDSVMSGETKVIPVIKETRVADVPRDVTREKINRALEIAEEEDEDMVSNDDDSDYEKEFFSRRHGNRDEDGRAAKIRNLFNSDKYDDDDEDYDEEDEFDDEYEEEPKKKKRSFFGFGKKKKSRDDDDDDFDDDYDDFDDDDDDYYDED